LFKALSVLGTDDAETTRAKFVEQPFHLFDVVLCVVLTHGFESCAKDLVFGGLHVDCQDIDYLFRKVRRQLLAEDRNDNFIASQDDLVQFLVFTSRSSASTTYL